MSQSMAGDGPPRASQVSLARILAVAQGDMAFVREMVDDFTNDTAAALVGFQQSLAQGNAQGVRKSAHSLKGLAATIDAQALTQLAGEAEQAAQAGDLASLSGSLASEVSAAVEGLKKLLGEMAP